MKKLTPEERFADDKEAQMRIYVLITALKQMVDYVAMRILMAGVIGFAGFLMVNDKLNEHLPKDDTDGEKRSEMILRTDYGTGCQFLETVKGGALTPRIANGKHLGCKE